MKQLFPATELRLLGLSYSRGVGVRRRAQKGALERVGAGSGRRAARQPLRAAPLLCLPLGRPPRA